MDFIFTTERLVFSRLRETYDADFIVELLNDPDFLLYIGDKNVRNNQDADNYIHNVKMQIESHGHCKLVGTASDSAVCFLKLTTEYIIESVCLYKIENKILLFYINYQLGLDLVSLKEDGAKIGICGLLKRDTLPVMDIGFAFLPAFRNQGYAFESCMGVLHDYRLRFGKCEFVAIVDPANMRSIRLCNKLGLLHSRFISLCSTDPKRVLLLESLNIGAEAESLVQIKSNLLTVVEPNSVLRREFNIHPRPTQIMLFHNYTYTINYVLPFHQPRPLWQDNAQNVQMGIPNPGRCIFSNLYPCDISLDTNYTFNRAQLFIFQEEVLRESFSSVENLFQAAKCLRKAGM